MPSRLTRSAGARRISEFLIAADRALLENPAPSRYAVALAAVILAGLITYALRDTLSYTISPFFWIAVMAAAAYGGIGPGLVAATLSVITIEYMVRTSQASYAPGHDTMRLLVLSGLAVIISALQAIWRRARQDSARATAREFRLLFEEAPIAYHEIDAKGVILRVNRRECEILGYRPEQMVGRPVWDFVVPDEREVATNAVRRKMTTTGPISAFERRYRTASGEVVCFEIHERAIFDREGRILGMRSALLDITARRKAEDEIRRLNMELEKRVAERTAELERSNADLQQFAYAASHDLQEPLRIISSYVELLTRRYRGKFDSDGDEFLTFIDEAAARMRRLIEDLLALSRVGSRERRPFEPVPLAQAVEQACANLRIAIEESAARIEYGDLPLVMGDAALLTQLLQNLLSNSLRYGSSEPPTIRIGAELRDGIATVVVADNGIGFDMRHAERIFGIFKRLHNTSKSGTGIGLAIARRIVERHGGRIWAESQPGQGARFMFTLEVAQSQPARSA